MTAAPEARVRRWRRGFSTIGCPELDLAAVADLAARHGLADLELRALAGTVDLPAALGGRIDEARALLAARGCRVHLVATPVRLLDGAAGLPVLLAFAEIAEALGARWLRVFDGGRPGAAVREWAPAGSLLAGWAAARASRGWRCRVLVETHTACASIAGIAALLRLDPGVELLWDAFHTWRHGDPPAAVWRMCGDRIRHVHIKDASVGDRAPFCAPGQGGLPLPAIYEVLDRGGFDGVVSLEWERLWHPELPPLERILPGWAQPG